MSKTPRGSFCSLNKDDPLENSVSKDSLCLSSLGECYVSFAQQKAK